MIALVKEKAGRDFFYQVGVGMVGVWGELEGSIYSPASTPCDVSVHIYNKLNFNGRDYNGHNVWY